MRSLGHAAGLGFQEGVLYVPLHKTLPGPLGHTMRTAVTSVLKAPDGVPSVSALRPHSVYSSMRWLTVRELAGRAPVAYATGATDRSPPVGLLPIYNRTSTNPRYHVDHILRGMPSNYVSHSPCFAGAMSGYLADLPTISSTDAEAALKALLTSAQEIAGKAETLIFPYITTATAAALMANIPLARVLLEGADAWLDVPSAPFEEYVESLRADDRRVVRRDFEAFRQAGLTASIEPLSDCVRSFAPLTVQNCSKYGQDCPEYSQDCSECGSDTSENSTANNLHNIAKIFGDDSVVFAARDGNRLVGGALGLIHEDTLYLREVGFDYSTAIGTHAYFVLCFHLPRRYAVDMSLKRIHLGLAEDQTKRTRGGRLDPLWTALINAKSTDGPIDLLNSERLAALSEVIGASQRGGFMGQVDGITRLKFPLNTRHHIRASVHDIQSDPSFLDQL